MPFSIRAGMWLSERWDLEGKNPRPTGMGRLQVIVPGPLNCRVQHESGRSWSMFPTENLLQWWRPLRTRPRTPDVLPGWVVLGAELTWNRWSLCGGVESITPTPVQVGQVRGSWFTTHNIENNELWFWNAEHLGTYPNSFRPNGPLPRFHRDAVL